MPYFVATWASLPGQVWNRWKNDAAILQYLAARTNTPLPRLQCVFEDDGAFYHCTELVEGVSMDKRVVTKELLQYIATLKSLRSDTPGVPGAREADIEPAQVAAMRA